MIMLKIYPQTFKYITTIRHLEIFSSQYLSSLSFCNLSNSKIGSNRTSYWEDFFTMRSCLCYLVVYIDVTDVRRFIANSDLTNYKNSQRELSRYSDMPGHSVLTGKY